MKVFLVDLTSEVHLPLQQIRNTLGFTQQSIQQYKYGF